jgi:hypothetical protein
VGPAQMTSERVASYGSRSPPRGRSGPFPGFNAGLRSGDGVHLCFYRLLNFRATGRLDLDRKPTRCGVRNDAAFEFQRSKSVDFCGPKVNCIASHLATLGGFGTKSQFWNTASNLESTIDPAFSRNKRYIYLYNL